MNITFKKIEEEDLELLRKWRMQDYVTKYMLTDPIITKESQIEWYRKISDDNSRRDYVIYADDIKIGYYGITNIDYEASSCETGFYIGNDDYRGKGLFKEINNFADNLIINNLRLNVVKLVALEKNPILRTYYKLGYIEDRDLKDAVNKNGEIHNVFHLSKTLVNNKNNAYD